MKETARRNAVFREDLIRSLSVVMYGDTDLYNLKYLAEAFRDELLSYPGISQVDIEGVPDLEFSIEGPDYYPWQYGLFTRDPYQVRDGHAGSVKNLAYFS